MIRPLRNQDLYGYMVLDDKARNGLAVYLQEGQYKGVQYRKIRINEIFLTKENKQMKFQRRPLTPYEKKKSTHYQRVSLFPHMMGELVEAIEKLMKDIGENKVRFEEKPEKQEIKEFPVEDYMDYV
jgi:hypothetical protein